MGGGGRDSALFARLARFISDALGTDILLQATIPTSIDYKVYSQRRCQVLNALQTPKYVQCLLIKKWYAMCVCVIIAYYLHFLEMVYNYHAYIIAM